MSHQRAIRRRPPPRRRGQNVPTYVMASGLMAAAIALAVAWCVGFTLTARQTTGVLVAGFAVPAIVVMGVIVGWKGDDRGAVVGFMLALSIPLSLVAVVSLVVFGAVTLGS